MRGIGIWLCSCCIVMVGAANLLGAPIERYQYRCKSLAAEQAGLLPVARIAVFLTPTGDERAVRAGLSDLGVDETDIEPSLLAGTWLVSTGHLRDAGATERVFDTLSHMESVEYVAPVYVAPDGTQLAVAPSLTLTGVESASSAPTAPDRTTRDMVPAVLPLDVKSGREVLDLRAAIATRADVASADVNWLQVSSSRPRYVVPGDVVNVTRYADGKPAQLPTETVWRAMCGGGDGTASIEQLKLVAEAHAALAMQVPAEAPQGGVALAPGLDLRFNIFSTLPDGAADAIAAVESYFESQFDDPVTVTINLQFAVLGAGILGATGSNYVQDTYSDVRAGLVSDMDFDDSIQDYLPLGGVIPVRYDGNSETVTSENRVFVTRANYNAAIGVASGTAASMTFNTDFAWDFTVPGISGGQYDFQSVLVHEVGHALGFTSGADFRTNDLEVLDLYRFQRSDGTGTNHNPDTLQEFQFEPRMVDQNAPGILDDVNSDLITVEYRMADGNPYQASHFHDQSPAIGIMDPTLGSGQSFFPDFLRQSDGDMFDAIGWDWPTTRVCGVGAPSMEPAPSPKNRYIGFTPPNAGTPIALRVRLVSLLSPVGGAPAGSPDFSAFTDQVRWVSVPESFVDSPSQGTTFLAAGLTCDPVCADFDGIDAVQVFGGEILPDSVYEVQAIRCSCDFLDETNYSAPYTVLTGHWGDVAEPFFSDVWSAQPDFNDIAAIVSKFTDTPGSRTKASTQLQPNLVDPAASISFKDVAAGVSGFLGGVYPFVGPCVCPSAVVCGETACANDAACGDGLCIAGFCADACGRCTP